VLQAEAALEEEEEEEDAVAKHLCVPAVAMQRVSGRKRLYRFSDEEEEEEAEDHTEEEEEEGGRSAGDVSPKDSSGDIDISHSAAGKGTQKECSTDPKKACEKCKKFHPQSSFTPAGWQGRGTCQICRNWYAKISLTLSRALSRLVCVCW
jgi:hypothetical protein